MWVLPEEHLVKGNSDRPDICFAVVRSMVQDLGSHVERRPENSFCLLVFRPQQLGKTKICYFDDPVVFEYVSQFKIPVHDLGLDQGLEGVEDLDEVLESFLLGELLLRLESSHEVALVAVL